MKLTKEEKRIIKEDIVDLEELILAYTKQAGKQEIRAELEADLLRLKEKIGR